MKTKSLKINFIMNAVLTMSSFIFPVITFPYVSRILMPEGVGKVSFATSVITYFSMFAQMGIPTYGIRACAKVRDDQEQLTKTVHEIFMINLFMSCAAYLFFGAALFLVPRLREEKVLFLIISLTIFFNAIGMEWLYKALEQYTYIAVRSIVFKFIGLLAMFALVRRQSDYVIYGGITILAGVGSNVLNFINVHRYISVKPLRGYCLTRHWKGIFTFFAMSVATTIYTNLDTGMLGFMKTDTDVGSYNAAVKIKTILVSIVTSLGVVLLPRASYYMEHGQREEFLRITKKALNFVVVVAAPMMLFFMIYAREAIFFLSGDTFAGSVVPMQIIMPTLLLIGMTNIMGIQMLVPMGRERMVLYSEIAGAAVDLIINVALIPRMASAGAAIGTLAAEIIVWIVQYIALRDMVGDAYRSIRYGVVLSGLLLSCVLSVWVKLLGLGSFTALAAEGVLFWGAYVLTLAKAGEPLILEIGNLIWKKLKTK